MAYFLGHCVEFDLQFSLSSYSLGCVVYVVFFHNATITVLEIN